MPYNSKSQLIFRDKFDPNVVVLKLFPSLTRNVIESLLNIKGLKGVVMETYGSGNAPTQEWFIEILRNAIQRGIIIYNVSQCFGGKVIHGRYATSSQLQNIGVISGWNITTEAAITKLMHILGEESDFDRINMLLSTPLRGEMDIGI